MQGIVVGAGGTVLVATGSMLLGWHDLAPGTDQSLFGITCEDPVPCVIVGARGTILTSTDGGTEWTSPFPGPASTPALGAVNLGVRWMKRPSGTRDVLRGAACPTSATCVAVGGDKDTGTGIILASIDSGATWHSVWRGRWPGMYNGLNSVACPTSRVCVARMTP